MPTLVKSIRDIKVGDLFEDCAGHPCLCILAGSEDDEDGVEGISLVDGSGPRCCSANHCGLRILTVEEAMRWKFHGPQDIAVDAIEKKNRWWEKKA